MIKQPFSFETMHSIFEESDWARTWTVTAGSVNVIVDSVNLSACRYELSRDNFVISVNTMNLCMSRSNSEI